MSDDLSVTPLKSRQLAFEAYIVRRSRNKQSLIIHFVKDINLRMSTLEMAMFTSGLSGAVLIGLGSDCLKSYF